MKEINEIMTEISFLFQIFVCSVLSDFHSFIIGEPHFISYFYENLKRTLDFHKNTTSKSTKKTGFLSCLNWFSNLV